MRQLFLGCELTITLVSTLWQVGSKICHILNFRIMQQLYDKYNYLHFIDEGPSSVQRR